MHPPFDETIHSVTEHALGAGYLTLFGRTVSGHHRFHPSCGQPPWQRNSQWLVRRLPGDM